MPEFATRIARKSASCHEPKISVSAPKKRRIALKTVKTFARTMLRSERLDASCSAGGRAASRAAASSAESPLSSSTLTSRGERGTTRAACGGSRES